MVGQGLKFKVLGLHAYIFFTAASHLHYHISDTDICQKNLKGYERPDTPSHFYVLRSTF